MEQELVGSGVCPRTFSMKAYTTSDVDGLITISPPALVPSPCVRPSSQSADGLQCVRVSWSHCRMVILSSQGTASAAAVRHTQQDAVRISA